MKNIRSRSSGDNKTAKLQGILFCAVTGMLFLWMLSRKDMISTSGDATDIWQTITTYYSKDRYYSYVLYKGFAAVYPYVWLYRLAVLFGLNDFFFIMLYYAILFSYLAVYGIPALVKALVKQDPALWQRILLIAVLFFLWRSTKALDSLMVDLPSCAYFVLATNGAMRLRTQIGWKKILGSLYTGLMCGLGGNISGQYSVAAFCIIIYASLQFLPHRCKETLKKKWAPAMAVVLILVGSFVAKGANMIFDATVIQPYCAQGNYMATGNDWMQRGLIFMIDKNRIFSGNVLEDPRGMAVLEDYYGAETAHEKMQLAAQGGYAWTIKDYLKVVLQYPQEFLPRYVDRFFICLSTDLVRNSLTGLCMGYSMLYLALFTAVKGIKKVKDFFVGELWIILGFIASVIPSLVLTVEMRYALSLQALVFGVALLGPALPRFAKMIAVGFAECLKGKSLRPLSEKQFPWGFLLWGVFVVCCLAHIGTIYAQSSLGTNMLFKIF